ncbi:MAG: hypothetical protein ACI4KA_08835 [Oscillospiraceae bacterium]
MVRLKVLCAYSAFAVLFVIVFSVLLAVITAAVICIPSGLFLSLVGGAMLFFDVSYVLTELAPEIMLFGGLFAASITAFFGFLSVKLGFGCARLFDRIRRYCDRIRGWR